MYAAAVALREWYFLSITRLPSYFGILNFTLVLCILVEINQCE